MSLCYSIDGLSVDKYGKSTVDAVFECFLWLNRKACNRASNFWVQDFVQDQKLFHDQKNISTILEYKAILICYSKYLKK